MSFNRQNAIFLLLACLFVISSSTSRVFSEETVRQRKAVVLIIVEPTDSGSDSFIQDILETVIQLELVRAGLDVVPRDKVNLEVICPSNLLRALMDCRFIASDVPTATANNILTADFLRG